MPELAQIEVNSTVTGRLAGTPVIVTVTPVVPYGDKEAVVVDKPDSPTFAAPTMKFTEPEALVVPTVDVAVIVPAPAEEIEAGDS